MILKILKTVGFIILGVFLLLFGISFSKVDKDSTNKLKDAWNNLFKSSASKLLLGNDSTTTNSLTGNGKSSTNTDTKKNTNPAVSTNPVVTINKAGVNISNYLGEFMITGTWAKVYGYNSRVNLLDYQNAFGFLADGTIVYREIVNEGYENEFETYHV